MLIHRMNVFCFCFSALLFCIVFQCFMVLSKISFKKKQLFLQKSLLPIAKNLIKIYTSMNTQIKRNHSEHYINYAV